MIGKSLSESKLETYKPRCSLTSNVSWALNYKTFWKDLLEIYAEIWIGWPVFTVQVETKLKLEQASL